MLQHCSDTAYLLPIGKPDFMEGPNHQYFFEEATLLVAGGLDERFGADMCDCHGVQIHAQSPVGIGEAPNAGVHHPQQLGLHSAVWGREGHWIATQMRVFDRQPCGILDLHAQHGVMSVHADRSEP